MRSIKQKREHLNCKITSFAHSNDSFPKATNTREITKKIRNKKKNKETKEQSRTKQNKNKKKRNVNNEQHPPSDHNSTPVQQKERRKKKHPFVCHNQKNLPPHNNKCYKPRKKKKKYKTKHKESHDFSVKNSTITSKHKLSF